MLRTLIDNIVVRWAEWRRYQRPLHFTLTEHRKAVLWRGGDCA